MTDDEAALRRCFAAVFPDLTDDEIVHATMETVEGWDSLASITLLALIEEEFGVSISEIDLPDAGSFAAVRAFLSDEQARPREDDAEGWS